MPKSLPAFLRLACPLYAAENEDTQLRVARLLWMCRDPRRAHNVYPGFAAISKSDLRAIFVSDKHARAVLAGKYFLVLQGDNLSNFTAGYQPAQNLLDAMEACVRSPEPAGLLGEDGRKLAAQRGAIAPRRAKSGTASSWNGIAPAKNVRVGLDQLRALEPFCVEALACDLQALVCIARNAQPFSTIPHRYSQSGAGRLFTEPPSLQSAPRPLRAAGLAGHWDYDIENCHFAIFAQLAKQAGKNTPNVDYYLTHKPEVRERLATDVDIEIDQAKTCLVMIMYGAVRRLRRKTGPAHNDWKPLAVAGEIGYSAAAKLFRHPWYRELHAEVQRTRQAVIAAHTNAGGFVSNRMQLAIHPGRDDLTESKQLAHILQGYEAAALREIVRRFGSRILLCLHDGWVTREPLDVAECEAAVLRGTGLHLRIEAKRLVHPMDVGPVRQVGNKEKVLVDQGLDEPEVLSYATRSLLSGCAADVVDNFMPHGYGGMVLGRRPRWNFLPEPD